MYKCKFVVRFESRGRRFWVVVWWQVVTRASGPVVVFLSAWKDFFHKTNQNADVKRKRKTSPITFSLVHRANEHLWVTATVHFHNLWDGFLPLASVTLPWFALVKPVVIFSCNWLITFFLGFFLFTQMGLLLNCPFFEMNKFLVLKRNWSNLELTDGTPKMLASLTTLCCCEVCCEHVLLLEQFQKYTLMSTCYPRLLLALLAFLSGVR